MGLTTKEAADAAKVSKRKIIQLIHDGELSSRQCQTTNKHDINTRSFNLWLAKRDLEADNDNNQYYSQTTTTESEDFLDFDLPDFPDIDVKEAKGSDKILDSEPTEDTEKEIDDFDDIAILAENISLELDLRKANDDLAFKAEILKSKDETISALKGTVDALQQQIFYLMRGSNH